MVLKSQSGSLHLSIMVPTGWVANIFSGSLGRIDNSSRFFVRFPGSVTHHFRYFISFKVSLQEWLPHILCALNCSTINLIGTPHCSLKSFKTIIVSLLRLLGKPSYACSGTRRAVANLLVSRTAILFLGSPSKCMIRCPSCCAITMTRRNTLWATN